MRGMKVNTIFRQTLYVTNDTAMTLDGLMRYINALCVYMCVCTQTCLLYTVSENIGSCEV